MSRNFPAPTTHEQRERIVALTELGRSVRDICQETGLGKSTVVRIRAEAGCSRAYRNLTERDHRAIRRMTDAGMSPAGIAMRLGISKTTINRSIRLTRDSEPEVAALDATAWMERARCVGHDPEIFFPRDKQEMAQAKAICGHCPVQAECRDWAQSQGLTFGIYGGVAPRGRRVSRLRATVGDSEQAVAVGYSPGLAATADVRSAS